MRERFVPPMPEPEHFVREALIVPDTNVLLNLYRLSTDAREDALGALRLVKERLRLPYQVATEFYGRVDEVRGDLDRIYAAVRKQTESLKAVSKLFGEGRRHEESREAVGGVFGPVVESLLKELDGLRTADPSRVDAESDPLLAEIEGLFGGGLLTQPAAKTIQDRVSHFVDYRVPNLIPPGYEDAKSKPQPLRAAGDYLIWCEVLDLAEQTKHPVLLLTDDTKGDWYARSGGKTSGPRRELVLEFLRRSPGGYHQMSLQRFVELARDALGASVSETSVDEIGAPTSDLSGVERALRERLDGTLYGNVVSARLSQLLNRPYDEVFPMRTRTAPDSARGAFDEEAMRVTVEQLLSMYDEVTKREAGRVDSESGDDD